VPEGLSHATAPPAARPPLWRRVIPSPRRLAPFALLGTIGLAAGGGVWLYLWLDHAAIERQVLREAGSLADTVAAQAGATLGGLEQMLLGIDQLGDAASMPHPSAFLSALSRRQDAAPGDVTLIVLSAEGQLLQATPASRQQLAGVTPGALAAVVAQLPSGPRTQAPAVVGQPLHATDGPLLPLSRRMSDGNLAVALLPIRLLQDFYAGLQLAPDSMVALIDRQARVLARVPALPQAMIGQPVPSAARLIPRMASDPSWNNISTSPLDGLVRYMAVRPVPGYPLAISLGLANNSAMTRWRQRATIGATLTVLLIAAAALAILLLEREASRRLATQAAATARLQRLADGAAGIASRPELPALLGYIARLTRETLAVPYACIALVDGGAAPQVTMSNDPMNPFPPDALAALEAWSVEEDALAPQAISATDVLPARLGITMQTEEGDLLGTLTVASRACRFSADEEAVLAQLARVASIAIRNRRLLAAAQRAAQDARTARGRMERLLEAMEQGFVALDAAWRITYANAAARRLMPRGAELPAAATVWDIYPHLVDLPVFEHLHAVASTGLPRSFEQSFAAGQYRLKINAFAAGDGVGVFFSETTPAAKAPAPQPEPATLAAAPTGIPPQEHVLLVEDEAPLRTRLARQLGQMGYHVTALADGPAALAALDQGLCPDLLLSDVIMPGGISGPRLATLARERLPDLRVLLMSGYALSEEDHDDAGEALMSKPCDPATLMARLHGALHGDAPRPV
jgi:CheY-like chemotaxis protein/PAS domain-containing protein